MASQVPLKYSPTIELQGDSLSTPLNTLLCNLPSFHKHYSNEKPFRASLKCGARAICPSITKLLNLSIHTGDFPEIWKCSKVAVLFQTGDIGQMPQIIAQFLFWETMS